MNQASTAATTKPVQFRRENFPNIAPYFLVNGAPKFIDFLVAAFNGTERIRVPHPDGSIMHAEVAIGNSVIELGDANDEYPQRFMSTHLYVPDADETYANALVAGATPVYAPTDDHPSGDRWAKRKIRSATRGISPHARAGFLAPRAFSPSSPTSTCATRTI